MEKPGAAGDRGARERWRLRVPLSIKIAGLVGVSSALVAVILAYSFSREGEGMLRQELSNRGRLAVLTLANGSAGLLLAQDGAALDRLASTTLSELRDASYVVVRDESGTALSRATRGVSVDQVRLDGEAPGAGGQDERVRERTLTVGGLEVIHLSALVRFTPKSASQYLDPLGLNPDAGGDPGAKLVGSVEIGFPAAELRAQVNAATRRSMGVAALVFLVCVVAMFPLARFVTRPLTSLSAAALGIAGGDLRQHVRTTSNDEVADLGRSFTKMVAELQAMVGELRDAAAVMARESETMLAAATRHAATATQQSASLLQMNASVKEIAQTSGAAIDHADRVIRVTQSAEESSRAGDALVEEAVKSTTGVEAQVGAIGSRLADLSGRAGEIGEIIGKVKDLALRSNVLALNAAIHAGRSGESGSSFTVIAREMRSLAEQSSATAGEVPRLLGQIAEAVQAAAAATQQGTVAARSTAGLAQRAGATIGSLAAVCRESSEAAREIAESAHQQASGVHEIVSALEQLSNASQENVEGSDEMKRMAERLQVVSGRLSALAERYRA